MDIARSGGYVPLNPYSPTLPPSTGTVSLASWYSYCQTCTTLYAHTVYFYFNSHGALEGWATSSDACTSYGTYPLTVYSSSSTLVTGSTLYELYSGVYYPINLVSFGPGYWLYDASQGAAIQMTSSSSNVISSVVSCGSGTYSLTMVAQLTSTLAGQYLWHKIGGGSWMQDSTPLYAGAQTLPTIYGIPNATGVMLVISDATGPNVGGSWIPTNIATGGMPAPSTSCTILGLTIYADTTGYAIGYAGYGSNSC
jgi:hypothetical protein